MKRLFMTMAFKNLARHRRRTVITAVALAAGVAIYIAMGSIMGGFTGEADRNLQEFEIGSAGFFAQGYWDERDQFPLDNVIEQPERLVELLDESGIPAAPRTSFRGELIIHYDPFPEDGSAPIAFTAVDPHRDPEVFRLHETVYDGRFLESGEEIIMGRWLAERLGAEVGFTLSVTTRTRDGFRQLLDLEIVGLYETFNPQTDRHMVYLPIDIAEQYLEMRGAVTALYVKLPERLPGTADLRPLERFLSESGLGRTVELLSFAEMTSEFSELEEMKNAYTTVMMALLAIIAIVGISNTMLMSVLERQKEIGMLRSMGFRDREIRSVFMLEAAGIGLLGAVAGLLLGSGLVWLLITYGIDYNAFMSDVDMSGYRFDGVLYGIWDPGSMVSVAVFAVIIAGIVAMLPTRRILRKSITDCLRK